ncbi:MAG: hypothetical protein ACEPOW_01870 [Bacteroidales bacterium]
MKTKAEVSGKLCLNPEKVSSLKVNKIFGGATAGYTVCTVCCGDNSMSCGPTEAF